MTKPYQIHYLVRAVIINNDNILLAYDPRKNPYHYYELGKSFYYLPGGHIESQEAADNALIREMDEETGYQIVIERFLGLLEHAWNFPGDEVCCHTHEINLIFKANFVNFSGCHKIAQRENHVAFKWVKFSDLPNTDLRPLKLKALIPKWLSEIDLG